MTGPSRWFALLREHERLLAINICTVLVMSGQGVVTPILPLYARNFGVGAATVGLTLSAFAFARMLLNVPLGILADRRGRRLLLVSGPLVTAIGMFGSGLAGDIGQLLWWRVVAGAGSALYMVGAQIYLIDISTPATRARFLGTNQGALLVGVSIGPTVGGGVAQAFGLRAPFLLIGAVALLASLYAFRRLPETRTTDVEVEPVPTKLQATGPTTGRAARIRPPWRRLLLSADFLAVAIVTMSIFMTRSGARQTLLPLLADSRFAMSPASLGLLFTGMAVITLIGLVPAARIADRAGRKWAIVPSGFVVAGGLLMLARADSMTAFVLAAVVVAAGGSIAGPAPAAYVADIAPADLRGVAMGMYRTAGDVGFVIGPPLLGLIADASTITWGLVAGAVVIALASGTFALFAHETAGKGFVPRLRRVDEEPTSDEP